jgi:hypothetical protein
MTVAANYERLCDLLSRRKAGRHTGRKGSEARLAEAADIVTMIRELRTRKRISITKAVEQIADSKDIPERTIWRRLKAAKS